ncbi:hypothetical protein GCM10027299_22020 [Larkinella ripae]
MEDIESAYKDFLGQINELFSCKIDGNKFRIETPFTTLTQSFISLFVIKQGDEYVIHDNGYIFDGDYGVDVLESDMETVREILDYYRLKLTDKAKGEVKVYAKFADLKTLTYGMFEAANGVKSLVDVLACSKS